MKEERIFTENPEEDLWRELLQFSGIGDRHYKNCINTNESVTGSASMQDALDNGWKPHPERTNQSTGSVGEIGDRHYKICINK